MARAALAAAKRAARVEPAERRTGRSVRRVRASGDERGLSGFAEAIDGLLAQRGWQATAQVAAVMGRWDSLVGAELAAHCRPESLEDGVLTLVAESTAWATQVRLLGRQVVERVNHELGAGVVRSVRVHGPTAPNWRKGPRRVLGRGPRDTYG